MNKTTKKRQIDEIIDSRTIQLRQKKVAKTLDLDPLYTQGYQLLKNHIKIPPQVKKYLIQLANDKSSAIFNHNEKSRKNDRKRRQVNIKPKSEYMIDFMDNLNQTMISLFPHLKPNDWVVLESKPGCKAQAAHTDYPPNPNRTIDRNHIPINVLVALEPNTRLNVWPNSHDLIIKECVGNITDCNDLSPIIMKVIKMNPRDIILFRGDLVHAGAAYEQSNCRMHCFLDCGYRIPNRTWLVHKNGSEFLKKMILLDKK
jgi:hypothetical protein